MAEMDSAERHLTYEARVRTAVHQIAHVPYAARRQAEIAEQLVAEIDALEKGEEEEKDWESKRAALLPAVAEARQFAADWDGALPGLRARPVERGRG